MAKQTRRTISTVRRPLDYDYTTITQTNQKNRPVKPKGILFAMKVFGPKLRTFKDKTKRTELISVHKDIVIVPRSSIRTHQDAVINAENMFVDTISFLLLC